MISWQDTRLRGDTAMARFLNQRENIGARRNANLAVTHATRLREVEELMASVFATSQDGILVVGDDDTVDMTNGAALTLFGQSEDGLTAQPIRRFIPDYAPVDQDSRYRETIAHRLDGLRFSIEYAVTTVGLDDHAVRVVVFRDITERKGHESTLKHQATHDPLTGLPNRTYLANVVEDKLAAAAAGHGFALLLLDLDRFKEINDTLGHDIGDDLLCRIAQRLRAHTDQVQFISRLGGDEFAVLVDPVHDEASALALAARLSARIGEPFVLRDLSLSVEASVGVAMFPEHASTMKDLLRCADVAMYAAKQRRVGISLYDANADRNSIRHLTLTGELKRAVEQNVMVLEYQPKLCLTTRRPLSAEALVRWTHPSLGRVAPDEFIPQAEQTGLIGALTQHTLVTAVQQMADWEKEGLRLSVAVNLSAQIIHDNTLPQQLDDLLRRFGIAPRRLTLELTESAIMHDPEGAMAVAHQITEIGVRLSIDDFGTGYSSLAYMSRLPVQELKIDRSFVSRMLASPTDGTIVRSTIDLAHSLGMEVVAEGIDQLDILHRLVALGCDYGQGFLIARPTPPAQVGQVIRDAIRTAHEEWGVGVGGLSADVLALRAAAQAELKRAAAGSD